MEVQVRKFQGQVKLSTEQSWHSVLSFGRGKDGREFIQIMLFAPFKFRSEYGEPKPKAFMLYDYRPEVVVAARIYVGFEKYHYQATGDFAAALCSVPAEIHVVTGPNGVDHVRFYPIHEPLPEVPLVFSLVFLEKTTDEQTLTKLNFVERNHHWSWSTAAFDDAYDWSKHIFFLSITDPDHRDEIVEEREDWIEVESYAWWEGDRDRLEKHRKVTILDGSVSEGKWTRVE